MIFYVRVPGLEPGTSPLSGVRSKPTELHAHIAHNNKKYINNQIKKQKFGSPTSKHIALKHIKEILFSMIRS